jgi:hypothetical protein
MPPVQEWIGHHRAINSDFARTSSSVFGKNKDGGSSHASAHLLAIQNGCRCILYVSDFF